MSINKGHYLELLDRIHVVICVIDDHLLNHPLTEMHSDVMKDILDASFFLTEAYQKVGSIEETFNEDA